MTLVYLSRTEVASLLPPLTDQLDLVESTYRAVAAGKVELLPKPGIHPRKDSFIHAMPAYLRDDDVAALCWVAGYPENKARGLPYISGLIVVNDAETGLPAAIMDAAEITAARTAAASGVCIRKWAPERWSEVAILGCGEQGRYHARVVGSLNPEAGIRAYDPHPDVWQPGPRGGGFSCRGRQGRRQVVTAGPIVEDLTRPADWPATGGARLPIDFGLLCLPGYGRGGRPLPRRRHPAVRGTPLLGHFRLARSLGSSARSTTEDPGFCCNLGVGALDAAFAALVLSRAAAEGAEPN